MKDLVLLRELLLCSCLEYSMCLDFELNLKINRTLVILKSSIDEGIIPHVPLCQKPKFNFLSIPILPIHHNKRHAFN